jgi:hypothetical protein
MKPNRRTKALPKITAVFLTESGGSKNTEKWVVLEFHLREAISHPYRGYVDVVTNRPDIDYATLIGKNCALVLSRGPKQERTFTGIVFKVEIQAQSADQVIVRFHMAAAVYALQHGKRSRVFENKSAAEIVIEVLSQGLKPFQREAEAKLAKKYFPREVCTQFQESDFDFISRLMADEGMFFYFDQSGKTEKLVLVDNNDACPVLTSKKAPTPKIVEPLPSPKLDSVILQVVENESSEPIPGVKIRIKLLSGIEETLTTNREGIAEKQVEPATYRVYSSYAGKHCDQYLEFVGEGESPIATDAEKSSPPNISQWPSELIICKVNKYKVKTGDTLLSLAYNCKMTPHELAYYNWGTWDKTEIEGFMRTKVGCTKKNQQGNYCFDDSDDPGIIYYPMDWELDNVPRNKTHTLRVRKVERGFGDISIDYHIDQFSDDPEDDILILESTDGNWSQKIIIAEMPEIAPNWKKATFKNVPSGKSFNILQDFNDGDEPIHFARNVSYGELQQWNRSQRETESQIASRTSDHESEKDPGSPPEEPSPTDSEATP